MPEEIPGALGAHVRALLALADDEEALAAADESTSCSIDMAEDGSATVKLGDKSFPVPAEVISGEEPEGDDESEEPAEGAPAAPEGL